MTNCVTVGIVAHTKANLIKNKGINIDGIPSIIWGEKSSKVFIAVHGNMSNKEDEVIKILILGLL